ncbi:membrane-bound lytic murein transglycosylase MltF [Saccharobesus litoralis]|uniref:Membrane-bound lytic murein transglycosylase F n=2 Tax=Saccharobesus litoralis TaxID=2172099 RepID=A0A2S0VXZ7_9ALTE|nr:membrane-bound lytic murein transglycosylase MltF [Saccharobesus litoralis]
MFFLNAYNRILSSTPHSKNVSSTCVQIFCLLSCLFFIGCKPDPAPELNHAEQIQQRAKIRIGTLYGQTTYHLAKDGPIGFEYELMSGFADFINVDLEIVPVFNLSELYPRLARNEIDFIASNVAITPERQKRYRFAPPYKTVTPKLIYKQGDTQPNTLNELQGTLVVTEDSSHAEWLQANQSRFPNLDWRSTADQDAEELMQAVLNDEIAYTIVDSNQIAINRRVYPELSIGFNVRQAEQIAWVFNRSQDDSLYALFIEYFGKINQDGSLALLEEKYYGHVREFNYVDTRKFLERVETTLPQYKPWFEQYGKQFGLDWRLLAALSYQESHWNPKAKSPTGVRGMMMLTLPTAKDVGIKNRLNAEASIKGGAKYLASLKSRIPARIQDPDRLWFALAAYNIGLGHLEDARVLTQRDGGHPDKWVEVRERLPWLRMKRYYKTVKYGFARGNEAVTYVGNIRRYYDSLVWLDNLAVKPAIEPNIDNKNSIKPEFDQLIIAE